MSKLVIGVDIDNTIVDSNEYWKRWLSTTTGWYAPDIEKYYDMSTPFSHCIDKDAALDFWRHKHLYDGMLPFDGVQEALYKWHSQGDDIVFISTLKGDHHKSKVQFIKKFFPYYAGFLGTKEKEYAKIDIMIDDSYEVLNRFTDPNVSLIYFDRGYVDHKDKQFIRSDVVKIKTWIKREEITFI